MKNVVTTFLMAVVLATPALTFAQNNNGPLTRAQVRAELVQIENAGYHPAQKGLHYPDDIQDAEAKVHAQSSHAYGPQMNSTNGSGSTFGSASGSNSNMQSDSN